MIRRAYEICSNEDELKKELDHLKTVFTVTNGYPCHLVSSVMEKLKKQQQQKQTTEDSEPPIQGSNLVPKTYDRYLKVPPGLTIDKESLG